MQENWQWRARVIASVQPWPRSRGFLTLRRVPMRRGVMASPVVENWFFLCCSLQPRSRRHLVVCGNLVAALRLPAVDRHRSGRSSWRVKMPAPQHVRNSLPVFLFSRLQSKRILSATRSVRNCTRSHEPCPSILRNRSFQLHYSYSSCGVPRLDKNPI